MESGLIELEIPKSTLKKIAQDPVKSAEAIHLEYIGDSPKGIVRKRKGKSFQYYIGNKRINNKKILTRIKTLVIPPAWENVWICRSEKGHLQATGLDKRRIKQYRYHNLWSKLRNETKYSRLSELGKALPLIRQQLENDMARQGMPLEKILAAIVMVMERTNIRIGNSSYEKMYGSFGLTTLKDDHVDIKGTHVKFSFKGKKGVEHSISLQDPKLSRLIRKCADIPGNNLFQYYDKNGKAHSIDSGMVNNYIKQLSGKNFSSKDFRTWEGSIHALLAIKEISSVNAGASLKRNEAEILNMVAKALGNTRNVCKKYYVHPIILELYETNAIDKYIKDIDNTAGNKTEDKLLPAEKVLMKILETNLHTVKI